MVPSAQSSVCRELTRGVGEGAGEAGRLDDPWAPVGAGVDAELELTVIEDGHPQLLGAAPELGDPVVGFLGADDDNSDLGHANETGQSGGL